jgi:polysaccharide pyruvyl transferase WcaK-like protein
MTRERPIRVGLLSPQSNRNLGDTATFAAAIAAYRRRLPAIELVVVVPEPEESARLLGTAGFPLYGDGSFVPVTAAAEDCGPFQQARLPGRLSAMCRVRTFVGELDAIVFTGGGLLDDFWGGPWMLPFWVFVWVAAARMRGTKVLFHAIGYDRLSSRTSRALMMSALRLAHYRSFRDVESLDLLRGMGLSDACEVIPDLAFALDMPPAENLRLAASRRYVIVNPVSERMWTHGHDGSYGAYLDAFVALSRELLDRGLEVKLLSTQDRMDADAIAYVADALRKQGRTNWDRVHVTRLDHFMALARQASCVVSSRLHGLILALVAGTPAVSVAPMRKIARVMIDVGLGDLNLDMRTLRGDALIANVSRALANEERLRCHVAQTVAEYRQRLNANFDRLIADGLLGERARRQFGVSGQLTTWSA